MQDRICRIDENLLQRTAGPYIRVKRRRTQSEQMWSGSPHKADLTLGAGECPAKLAGDGLLDFSQRQYGYIG
jgi:hypothetical protein